MHNLYFNLFVRLLFDYYTRGSLFQWMWSTSRLPSYQIVLGRHVERLRCASIHLFMYIWILLIFNCI